MGEISVAVGSLKRKRCNSISNQAPQLLDLIPIPILCEHVLSCLSDSELFSLCLVCRKFKEIAHSTFAKRKVALQTRCQEEMVNVLAAGIKCFLRATSTSFVAVDQFEEILKECSPAVVNLDSFPQNLDPQLQRRLRLLNLDNYIQFSEDFDMSVIAELEFDENEAQYLESFSVSDHWASVPLFSGFLSRFQFVKNVVIIRDPPQFYHRPQHSNNGSTQPYFYYQYGKDCRTFCKYFAKLQYTITNNPVSWSNILAAVMNVKSGKFDTFSESFSKIGNIHLDIDSKTLFITILFEHKRLT